jgi:hypothetical protein
MGCPVLDSELQFTPILEEIGANIARSGFYFLPTDFFFPQPDNFNCFS